MKSSDKLDQLAASLYAAQRDLKNPKKDATASIPTKSGGTYSFEYTSLPALLDHIRGPLNDTGLAIINDLRPDGEYTTITHLSGQWMELGPYPITNTTDAKQRGAEQTYARRYILAGIMRIAPGDEDLDEIDTTSERGGEGEPPAYGEGADDITTPDPPPSKPDKQRWMEEFHPGKPHKMRPSPVEVKPPVMICKQGTLGKADCPYTEDVKP